MNIAVPTLITDTCHQWKHSMNFGRGFDVYRKIRGQVSDRYKDPSVISIEEVRRRYIVGRSAKKARQYLANVQGRKSEEDWFAPRVFTNAMEVLEEARRQEPFFLVADCFDPHEPWDPPKRYVDLYDPDGYEGKEPLADSPAQGGRGEERAVKGQRRCPNLCGSGDPLRTVQLGSSRVALVVFAALAGHAAGRLENVLRVEAMKGAGL